MLQGIRLSEDAVAVLRFEINGWKAKDPAQRLPTYRELAEAGIMEPVPSSDGEYRFTAQGLAERERLLEREAARIERERIAPPDVSRVSEAAWDVFRRRAAGEDVRVTPETRPAYRELAAARLMDPVSGFAAGPESAFRFTYWGWNRRHEWMALPSATNRATS